ncbi:MAG: divergent polysaccharide deacetylase family protein [Rhodospirillales bacterium]
MKLFGKKLFGKKDEDDDEDFDEDDFALDDEDLDSDIAEADELNEALAAQNSRNEELEEGKSPLDEGPGPATDEGSPAPTDDLDLDAVDFDVDADASAEPGASDADDDLDDDFDGDYDDDDDFDDEAEEGGRLGGILANPTIRYSVLGFVIVLLLGGLGAGGWWFLFSGDGEEIVAEESQRGIPIAPAGDSSGSGQVSLNDFASGGGLQPPSDSQVAGSSPDQSVQAMSSGDDVTQFQTQESGGLNVFAGGGLNAMAPGAAGSGVVVPMATAASFSRYPDLPSTQPLSNAPDADLMEIRGDGVRPLPKKGQDGRTPFNVYARPVTLAEGQSHVALVVTDLGLNRAGTIAAIRKLPPEVTLSFSPYAEELDQWMVRARRAGHEVMVGLPMESDRFPIEDPGPLGLMTVLPPDRNLSRFFEVISQFQGFIGVEVVMGNQYTMDPERVRPILQVLADRGLMILDGAWNERSAVPRIANELGVPVAVSDLRLDTVMARSAIDTKLEQLEDTARTRRVAIGTTTVNPAIIDRLSAWFVALQINNVRLVPVSALVNQQDLS